MQLKLSDLIISLYKTCLSSLLHKRKVSNYIETVFLHITILPVHFNTCLVLKKFLFADVTALQSCETVFCWLQSPLKIGCLRPFFHSTSHVPFCKPPCRSSHSSDTVTNLYLLIIVLSAEGVIFEKSRMQMMDPIVCSGSACMFVYLHVETDGLHFLPFKKYRAPTWVIFYGSSFTLGLILVHLPPIIIAISWKLRFSQEGLQDE